MTPSTRGGGRWESIAPIWTSQARAPTRVRTRRIEEAPRARARESLSTHLDRVIVRLTSLRAGETPEAWDAVLDEFVRTLDAMHPAARRARGEARERLLADLEALDARLLERARAVAGADVLADAAREATAELEPFATRLSPAAYLGRAPALRASRPARAAAAADAHPGLTEAL